MYQIKIFIIIAKIINGTDCIKYKAFVNEDKISGNVCGVDILTNNYKRPYMDYEECKNDINQNTKYKR